MKYLLFVVLRYREGVRRKSARPSDCPRCAARPSKRSRCARKRQFGADKRDYAHTASVLGNVSTVTVILGLIPLAGGVYLWKTSSASVTATQVGSDHAGVTISGHF